LDGAWRRCRHGVGAKKQLAEKTRRIRALEVRQRVAEFLQTRIRRISAGRLGHQQAKPHRNILTEHRGEQVGGAAHLRLIR
jgi:hypothetical protein